MNLEIRDAARVGRDSNDARWVIVRYAEDFPRADTETTTDEVRRLRHLDYDPKRGVLELDAAGLRFPDGREWLPLEPVADGSGRRYRSDPAAHRILTAPPCSDQFVPLSGIGGHGFRTGELNRPLGLSLDHRGWLVVADADNHRVQIVDGSDVVVVLGRTDAWGRPVAGARDGAMREPTHAVVDPTTCRVFVADRAAGLIHVFDARFRYVRSLEPKTSRPRPPTRPARPAALALQPDGSLLVLDTSWPRVLHLTTDGEPLAELNLSEAPEAAWTTLVKRRRYAGRGQALIGPLDGNDYDAAWHRVVLEVSFPPGTSATVQTFATNDETAVDPSSFAWAPASPVALPGPAASESTPGEFSRLVVSDTEAWARWQHGPYARAYPELVRFAGNGPNATDHLLLPAAILQMVRSGDTVEIADDTSAELATLGALPAVGVAFRGSGVARAYGPTSTIALIARDGEMIPGRPRRLYQLGPGETIDLSAWDPQAAETTVSFLHEVAAFLRAGDVVSIETTSGGPPRRAELQIAAVLWADTMVALAAPVSRDFRTSRVLLHRTPGRLFVDDMSGFEFPLPRLEPFTVTSIAGRQAVRVHFVEEDTSAIWLEPGDLPGPAVTYDNWATLEPEPARATDRGRFFWVLLKVNGSLEHPASSLALDTPSIRSFRALLPRLSYLRYLPRVFSRRDEQKDASGAIFLERFLALFEERLTRIETSYERVSRELNPLAAHPDWLLFIGTWLGLAFDPSWDDARRRQLVAAAADLFRTRGTKEGLSRYVEIYTGRRPEILEGYQVRPSQPLIVGRAGTLGPSPLRYASPDGQGAAAWAAHAHRFTLFVFFDDACDFEVKQAAVRRIVESTKPAHTEYSLCFVTPEAKVGLQSTVGLDMLLGGPDTGGFALGRDPSPLDRRKQPLVGYDRISSSETGRRASQRLQQGGQRLDRGFSIG